MVRAGSARRPEFPVDVRHSPGGDPDRSGLDGRPASPGAAAFHGRLGPLAAALPGLGERRPLAVAGPAPALAAVCPGALAARRTPGGGPDRDPDSARHPDGRRLDHLPRAAARGGQRRPADVPGQPPLAGEQRRRRHRHPGAGRVAGESPIPAGLPGDVRGGLPGDAGQPVARPAGAGPGACGAAATGGDVRSGSARLWRQALGPGARRPSGGWGASSRCCSWPSTRSAR